MIALSYNHSNDGDNTAAMLGLLRFGYSGDHVTYYSIAAYGPASGSLNFYNDGGYLHIYNGGAAAGCLLIAPKF